MGWRVSGVVIAWIAFSIAFQQPPLAVALACLAGWLFGRGRGQRVSTAQPPVPEDVQPRERAQPAPATPGPAPASTAAVPTARSTAVEAPKSTESPKPPRQLDKPVPQKRQPSASDGPARPSAPAMVTRTSANDSGARLLDPYDGTERRWTRSEQVQLLDHYERGRDIPGIAAEMRTDQREVAIRLIRLLLSPSGNIADESGCPRHGKNYDRDEVLKIEDLHRGGLRLRSIANEVERTQLGVGWKLLSLHVPGVPASVRGDLRSDNMT